MSTGIQWENENELRGYPLAEGSSRVDDSGRDLPDSILVDMSVVCFGRFKNLRLGSVRVGPGLTSLSLLDDAGPVAVVTVPSVEPYVPVALDSLRDGVSGTVVFGEFDRTSVASYRFSTAEQSAISPFCVVEFPDTGVRSFVDDASGEEASGDVAFNFGGSVVVSVETTGTGAKASLGLSNGVARSLSAGCVPTDLNKSCIAPVIRTINGVSPDRNGEIAIVFE